MLVRAVACRRPHLLRLLPCHGAIRNFSSSKPMSSPQAPSTTPKMKVTILGANGGIGQPLSLLMKHSTICTHLSLYDLVGTIGVAADLGHIETRCKVKGYMGPHKLHKSLADADIVLIPAGVPRNPGMTRDDLFKTNASIIFELVHACSEICPKAVIGIISNPVNSMVPIAAEVLKKDGVLDHRKLFGVTTLDVVRANAFIAEKMGIDPAQVYCPVIGGHSGATIIPVISQCIPKHSFSEEEVKSLTERIQQAGTEVVKAKDGAGSATLSMAYAAARFTFSMMRAMRGESGVIECAYIKTDVEDLPYFASQLLFGPNGLERPLGVGKLSLFEKQLLRKAMPILLKNIERGEKFAKEKL